MRIRRSFLRVLLGEEKRLSFHPLARVLTYAGFLPFFALALLVIAGRHLLGFDAVFALQTYSLAIAAFMAGTVWGYTLPAGHAGGAAALLLASNAVTLVVFFAALARSPRVTLGVDAGAFIALFLVDAWAARLGRISRDYLILRLRITALVALALGAAWVAL